MIIKLNEEETTKAIQYYFDQSLLAYINHIVDTIDFEEDGLVIHVQEKPEEKK